VSARAVSLWATAKKPSYGLRKRLKSIVKMPGLIHVTLPLAVSNCQLQDFRASSSDHGLNKR
jgi:hypothetical protein